MGGFNEVNQGNYSIRETSGLARDQCTTLEGLYEGQLSHSSNRLDVLFTLWCGVRICIASDVRNS